MIIVILLAMTLSPSRLRPAPCRFVAITDSSHTGPIFLNLASDRMVDGPNQMWVADITYITITTGFVYLAAILDAWSRSPTRTPSSDSWAPSCSSRTTNGPSSAPAT